MIEATGEFLPTSRGDARALAEARAARARHAEPFATMPPPANVRELAKSTIGVVRGSNPNLLIDKLGERLAFERSGVRLYEALISKHDAGRSFRGGPSREELVQHREEERAHFEMLEHAIESVGGDPTVVTPSANLQATASLGLCAVLADPRTDVQQCLEAMLVASSSTTTAGWP
jgi:hypothetical protein